MSQDRWTRPMMDRRALLSRVGLLGAAGLAGGLAAGCTTTPEGSPPAGNNSAGTEAGGRVELPTFTPYEDIPADLPGLPNGTAPYFAAVPAELPRFLDGPPASGGTIEGFTIMNTTPVPAERNPHWQAVNDLLGTELQMSGAPIGDFGAKFQTLAAGDAIPDFSCVIPSSTPQLPGLLQAEYQDLTELLGGDAVNDYPALANIPSYQWLGGIVNNSIYLIPSPRYNLFRTYLVRSDVTEALGVDPEPKNGEELGELLAALTNPRQNQYATISASGLLDMVNEMMGTPNGWSVEDGKFQRMYETEQFAEALKFVAEAWDKGYIHPDAFSPNLSTNANALYAAGDSPLFPAVPNWSTTAITAKDADSEAQSTAITLHPWDGGSEPVMRWLGPGTFYFTAIKKADPERVREILSVINALASPFGTQEYMTIAYGTEGEDYTISDGQVEVTETGQANQLQPIVYLGSPPPVHFATDPAIAEDEYHSEATAMEHTAPRPIMGLASETNDTQGAEIDRLMRDAINGIIQGNRDMTEWEGAVAEWRSMGGDQIRSEYEAAYEAANS